VAWATSADKLTLQDLADRSTLVVRGTVLKVQARWDHGQRIVTDVDVQVTETLKGGAAPRVRVTQPGGAVGNIGQAVEGVATFREGEDVVVFLRLQDPEHFRVVGMSQGKFHVTRTTLGKWVAEPSATETVLVDPRTQEPSRADLKPLELGSLRALLKTSSARPSP
jgi:hypothetical protein